MPDNTEPTSPVPKKDVKPNPSAVASTAKPTPAPAGSGTRPPEFPKASKATAYPEPISAVPPPIPKAVSGKTGPPSDTPKTTSSATSATPTPSKPSSTSNDGNVKQSSRIRWNSERLLTLGIQGIIVFLAVIAGAYLARQKMPPPTVALPSETLTLLKYASQDVKDANQNAVAVVRTSSDAHIKDALTKVAMAEERARHAEVKVATAEERARHAEAVVQGLREEQTRYGNEKKDLIEKNDKLKLENANQNTRLAEKLAEKDLVVAKKDQDLARKDNELLSKENTLIQKNAEIASLQKGNPVKPVTEEMIVGWMRKAFQDNPPQAVSELLSNFGELKSKVGAVNLKEIEERWRQIATRLTIKAQRQDVLLVGVRTGDDPIDDVPAQAVRNFFRLRPPSEGHKIGYGWIVSANLEMKIGLGQSLAELRSLYDSFSLPGWDKDHSAVNLPNKAILSKLKEQLRDPSVGRVVLIVPRTVQCPVSPAGWNTEGSEDVAAWKKFELPLSVIVYGPAPVKDDSLPAWEEFCSRRNRQPDWPRELVLTAKTNKELFEALHRFASPIPEIPTIPSASPAQMPPGPMPQAPMPPKN